MNIYKFGVAVLVAGSVALPAAADDTYHDSARVLSVTPRTERINSPRQECHTDYSRDMSYSSPSTDRSYTGAIIGGVAGGLLGGQVGKGKGRVAAAAIGAATGAVVGDRIDNRPTQSYEEHPVEHCTSVDNWQTVSRGYQVTYRYNGRDYTTVMPNDPGDTLNIRVSIAPEIGSNVSSLESGYRHDNGQHRGWSRHHDGGDD